MVRAIREETELGEKKSDERVSRRDRQKIQKRRSQRRGRIRRKKAKAREKVVAKAAGMKPSRRMTDQKLNAVVARSRCGSRNEHLSFGALLEVELSKKCTLLWREVRFTVKSVKNY